jgi:short-subunit dehydrogenase involved in D-alanine esterification of teichoic acids
MKTNGNKIEFIDTRGLSSDEILNLILEKEDILFLYSENISQSKIKKFYNRIRNNYKDFGIIITNFGIFADSSKINSIEKKTNLKDDLYYQTVIKGIISIKDEFIDNYV